MEADSLRIIGVQTDLQPEEAIMKKEKQGVTVPSIGREARDVPSDRIMIARVLQAIGVIIKVAAAARAVDAALTVGSALREEMQGRTIDSQVKRKIRALLRKHP